MKLAGKYGFQKNKGKPCASTGVKSGLEELSNMLNAAGSKSKRRDRHSFYSPADPFGIMRLPSVGFLPPNLYQPHR